MDDEKVQKHISKKLAKQQVPQRKTTQKKVDLFSHLHQYEKDISLTKDIRYSKLICIFLIFILFYLSNIYTG